MVAAVTAKTRYTCEEAQALLHTTTDPIVWALANTIVSLHTAHIAQECTIDDLVRENETQRKQLDELQGVVR